MSIIHRLIAKKLNARIPYGTQSHSKLRSELNFIRFNKSDSTIILKELKKKNLITFKPNC